MSEPMQQAQVDAANAYEALFVPALFRQWAWFGTLWITYPRARPAYCMKLRRHSVPTPTLTEELRSICRRI